MECWCHTQQTKWRSCLYKEWSLFFFWLLWQSSVRFLSEYRILLLTLFNSWEPTKGKFREGEIFFIFWSIKGLYPTFWDYVGQWRTQKGILKKFWIAFYPKSTFHGKYYKKGIKRGADHYSMYVLAGITPYEFRYKVNRLLLIMPQLWLLGLLGNYIFLTKFYLKP